MADNDYGYEHDDGAPSGGAADPAHTPSDPAQAGEGGAQGKHDADGKKGILSDLQKERERRRDAERQRDQLSTQIAQLQGQFEEFKSSFHSGPHGGRGGSQDDPAMAEDDDEVITRAQARQLAQQAVTAAMTEQQKQRQQETQQQQARRFAQSEAKAMARYTPEKAGEGLDYESVFEAARELIRQNPGYQAAIQNAEDPAEEVYRIGSLHPQIQRRIQEARSRQLVSQMDGQTRGRSNTGRGGQATGIDSLMGGVDDTQHSRRVAELMNKPQSELEAMLREAGQLA